MFLWENSHRREFHTSMAFLFRIAITCCLHDDWVISYLVIWRYTSCWWNKREIQHNACATRCSLQTDFTPKSVVVSCLHDTVARFRAWVKFSPQYNNLGKLTPGYHVNKFRAMRGNRSGLVPAPKSLRCHVNTPLRWRFLCSDWCAHLARLRFPLLFPQENFSFWSDNKSLIDSGLFGQDGWKLA